MCFFKIIVPNYNNAEWFERCLASVVNQTFKDYKLVFVDDKSDEKEVREIVEKVAEKNSERMTAVFCQSKVWNGGARNIGLSDTTESEYTVFLDSDDMFADENWLKDLHDFIVENNMPDCVRLSYVAEFEDHTEQFSLSENTPETLVSSLFVACWTKVIKSNLIVPFPENTLMEDVVQHIKQCDRLTSVAVFGRFGIIHNGRNKNSCSSPENQDKQNGKWKSSMFRYMADLMDLTCEHSYCEAERQKRASICLSNIKKGVYWQ